jgi:hypothetical protein
MIQDDRQHVVPSHVMGLWRVFSLRLRERIPRNDFVGLESAVGVQFVNPGASVAAIQYCSAATIGQEFFRDARAL